MQNILSIFSSVAFSVLIGCFAAACDRKPAVSVIKKTEKPDICILTPAIRSADAPAYEKALNEIAPDARHFAASDLSAALSYCTANHAALIIPWAENLSITSWGPIEQHIYQGGRVLFWSPRPTSERVVPYLGTLYSFADWIVQVAENSVAIPAIPPISSWSHRFDQSIEKTDMATATLPSSDRGAVEVDTKDYVHFDALMVSIPEHAMDQVNDAVTFYAKGRHNTTRMAVYCTDRQGHKWVYPFAVKETWTPVLAHKVRFTAMDGATNQAPFSFGNMASMAIGLFDSIAPQLPGMHHYALSDIRAAGNPVLPIYLTNSLHISPLFNTGPITLRTNRQFTTPDGASLTAEESLVYGALPALRHSWMQPRMLPARIRPVIHPSDDASLMCGAIFSAISTNQVGMSWAWMGVPPPAHLSDSYTSWMKQVLIQLKTPTLGPLANPTFRYSPHKEMQVELPVINNLSATEIAASYRLIGELRDRDGRILRRVGGEIVHQTNNLFHTSLHFGMSPAVPTHLDGLISLQIEERSADGKQVDRLTIPIKFIPEKNEKPAIMHTSGSRFINERQTAFVTGTAYTPPLNNWIPSWEKNTSFLMPAYFDPEQIIHDLDQLKKADINTVLFTITRLEEADAFLFIAEELQKRNMTAALYLPRLTPESVTPQLIHDYVNALHLDKNSASILFLAPPSTRTWAASKSLETAWNRWLKTQYGTLTKAKQNMAKSGLLKNNSIPLPDPALFASDGLHRIQAAVFRRFADDWFSRRYGFIVGYLDSLGCQQLISAYPDSSSGIAGMPFDITTAAHHFDFITASAAALDSFSSSKILSAGFITAYARGARGTIKPVLWADCGIAVGDSPQPADLDNQVRVFDDLFTMLYESLSAGLLCKSYSTSIDQLPHDCGITSYLDEWRPVRMAFQRNYRRMKNNMLFPAPWQGRYFQCSIDARGLPGLWDRWQHVYLNESRLHQFTEIRPYGFDTTTENMPMLAVGGLPHVAPAPFESANAEWGQPSVNGTPQPHIPDTPVILSEGDTLLIPLINSGLSSWIPYQKDLKGSVCVKAIHENGTEKIIPVPLVAAGQQHDIRWNTAQKGRWHLRAYIQGVDFLGEILYIDIQ